MGCLRGKRGKLHKLAAILSQIFAGVLPHNRPNYP